MSKLCTVKIKLLLIAFILGYNLNVNAQIPVITNATGELPGLEKTFQVIDTTCFGHDFEGPNKIWDFSTYTTQSEVIYQVTEADLNYPNSSVFPNANMVALQNGQSYAFINNSNSKYEIIGSGGPTEGEISGDYSDPETVIEYPFTYGSEFSDTSEYSYLLSGFLATTTIFIHGECVGYGKMILNLGGVIDTIEDVILTKRSCIELDTIPAIQVGQHESFTVYQWLGTHNESVLAASMRVYDSTVGEPLIFANDIVVSQLETPAGFENVMQFENIELFPNPATDHISLRLKNKEFSGRVELIDLQGRCVKKLEIKNQSNPTIATDDLVSGVYVIKLISTNGNVAYQKFNVNR